MELRKTDRVLPVVKMHTNSEPSKQPENTVRFALNAVDASVDGSIMSLVNEPGNIDCIELPSMFIPNGFITLSKNETVGFYVDKATKLSYIILLNTSTCTYEIVVEHDLGFSRSYPITGVSRVRRGCDRVVYFRDSFNKDRFFNFDKPFVHQTNGVWDNNLFSYSPDVTQVPLIFNVLENSGNLKLGVYYFVVEFFDEFKNVLYRTLPEGGISIYNGSIELNAKGGTNNNIFSADVGGEFPSSKAIRITMSNVGMYAYAKISVLAFNTSDGSTYSAHTVGDYIGIFEKDEITFTYRGYNVEYGDFEIDPKAILQRMTHYTHSGVIKYEQNRFVKADLAEEERDYSSYQRYASKIRTQYKTETLSYGDIVPGHCLHPNTIWEKMSERGDEVKAYGICFVHSNGDISPPLHLPGRRKKILDDQLVYSNVPLHCYLKDISEALPVEIAIDYVISTDCVFELFKPICSESIMYSFAHINLERAYVKIEEYPDSGKYYTDSPVSDEYEVAFIGLNNERTFFISIIMDNGITYETKFTIIVPVANGDEYTVQGTEIATFTPVESGHHNKVENWKVKSTATSLSSDMGYHETCDTYYEPVQCVEDYWGRDYDGELLEGQKIRHHRLPDRYTIPHLHLGSQVDRTGPNEFTIIGVEFSNIEYPNTDVVGHFFVCGLNDETVSACGYMLPTNNIYKQNIIDKVYGKYVQQYYEHDGEHYDNDETALQNLITLEHLFDKKYDKADYLRVNQIAFDRWEKDSHAYAEANQNLLNYPNFYKNDEDLKVFFKPHALGILTKDFDDSNSTYKLIRSLSVPPKSESTLPNSNVTLYNGSHTSTWNIIQLDQNVVPLVSNGDNLADDGSNFRYVTLKRAIDSYSNLNLIRYRKIHPNVKTLADNQIVFGGNIFISRLTVTNIPYVSIDLDKGWFDPDGETQTEYEYIENMFFESPINASLRYKADSECGDFYNNNISLKDLAPIKTSKPKNNGSNEYDWRLPACEEIYSRNKDFSKVNDFYFYTPFSKFFDYCSKCLNEYPTRIAWTDPSTEEQIEDVFRNFKPLNYIDLPSNKGRIIDISFTGNMMLIRTEDTLFTVAPNPQVMNTSESTVYLGTGEYLSLPPNELVVSEIGKYGQQDRLASESTPYGEVWADNDAGEIYLFTNQIASLSDEDIYFDLKKLLPSYSVKQAPYINLARTDITYDDLFKRIIIHKTDYGYTALFHEYYNSDKIEYDDEAVCFYLLKPTPSGPPIKTVIELSDPKYFVNLSFTLSYSLLYKGWKSYHSYQPELMFRDYQTFYVANGNKIRKQNFNKTKFNYYNGQSFPYIVEFVIPSLENTSEFEAIHYYAKTFNGDIEVKEVTFDQMIAYTNNQSTGLKNVLFQNSPFANVLNHQATYVAHVDKNYKISKLKDLSTARPVISKEWINIQSYYNANGGYIDKVPLNVDANLHLFKQAPFRDKFLIVRLIFNNSDHKIVTDLIETLKFYSIR